MANTASDDDTHILCIGFTSGSKLIVFARSLTTCPNLTFGGEMWSLASVTADQRFV